MRTLQTTALLALWFVIACGSDGGSSPVDNPQDPPDVAGDTHDPGGPDVVVDIPDASDPGPADVPVDAIPELPQDPGPVDPGPVDPGPDVGPDAEDPGPVDIGPDVSIDTGTDVASDSGTDVPVDQATPDTQEDTSPSIECVGLTECLTGCVDDAACRTDCWDVASQAARTTRTAFETCLAEQCSGCSDPFSETCLSRCANEASTGACKALADACAVPVRVACAEFVACSLACASPSGCDCPDDTYPLIENLKNCVVTACPDDSDFDAWLACCNNAAKNGSCRAEYDACMADSLPVP